MFLEVDVTQYPQKRDRGYGGSYRVDRDVDSLDDRIGRMRVLNGKERGRCI